MLLQAGEWGSECQVLERQTVGVESEIASQRDIEGVFPAVLGDGE